MKRIFQWRPALLVALLLPMNSHAWEEQAVLEYILANNSLLQAYQNATTEHRPKKFLKRLFDHTSLYGRAGAGGTDFRDQPYVLQAGIQITIPLASSTEKRTHAMKRVEERRATDEVRDKVMNDIALLRKHEADLAATRKRIKFYKDKSGWLQKRVDQGYDDVNKLWDIGQKLNEERASAERLNILVSSQRFQVAHHAGDRWEKLLNYLKNKAKKLI